jgi:hypothetical protein
MSDNAASDCLLYRDDIHHGECGRTMIMEFCLVAQAYEMLGQCEL